MLIGNEIMIYVSYELLNHSIRFSFNQQILVVKGEVSKISHKVLLYISISLKRVALYSISISSKRVGLYIYINMLTLFSCLALYIYFQNKFL